MNLFVSAIGTDSGKTVAAAILTEALQADYWKPVQAGFPRDTDTVSSMVSNGVSRFHPEAYLLQHAESPHAAARKEGLEIALDRVHLPATSRPLVVEGAGGLMAPLNDEQFVADLIKYLGLPVVLVADLYLGSINHTLLTVNELKRREIKVAGIVFNGPSNPESEAIILRHSGYPCLWKMTRDVPAGKEMVQRYASQLNLNLLS